MSLVDILLKYYDEDGIYEQLKEANIMFPGDPNALQKYYAKSCLENGFINPLQYLEQMYYLNEAKKK